MNGRLLLVIPLLAASACLAGPRLLDGLACDPEERCGPGYTCIEGICLVDGADAGQGGADREAYDAEVPDGTSDSARPDAWQRDGSSPDLGLVDAALDDAAVVDAVLDAGAVDGGQGDAGGAADASDGGDWTDAAQADTARSDVGWTADAQGGTDTLVADSARPDGPQQRDGAASEDAVAAQDAAHPDTLPADQAKPDTNAPADVPGPQDSGQPPMGPPMGIIANFPFRDGSGNVVTDMTSQHTGVLTGGAWGAGWRGGGIHFDGNDLLSLGPDASLNALYTGTVSLRVYRTGGTGTGDLIRNYNVGQDPRFFISITGDGIEVLYQMWGSGGHEDIVYGTASFPGDADWHYVAFGSDSNGHVLYIDGNETALDYIAGTADVPVFYGHTGPGTDYDLGVSFSGGLDEVRLYNRKLNAADVLQDLAFHPPVDN